MYLSVFDKHETIFTLHIFKAESQSNAAFEWVLSQIYFVGGVTITYMLYFLDYRTA